MARDPLYLILQRMEVEPPVFGADEVHRQFGPALERLACAGLLRETSPSGTAACPECGAGYVGRIELISHQPTGTKHAYLPCPECGPVEVPLEQLQRWAVDIPAFLTAVSTSAGIRGPGAEVASGRLWRLGKATWVQRSWEVYFARNCDPEDGHAVDAAMARRPRAVLFLPTEAGVRTWGSAPPNVVIALESVIALGPTSFWFDHQFVEGRLIDAGLTDATKAKRSPRKRGERAAKIEKLTREMVEHLRAARDHAFSTQDRAGTPELLPRPSQKDLAKRTGMSESDVSRCLKDGSAKELKLYWETALHLDQIMRWQGRVGGKRPM